MYRYDIEEEKLPPPAKLKENRSFLKFLLFSFLTLGIYTIVFYISVSFDINKIASKHDGKNTMNYLFAFLLGIFTGSIVVLIWYFGITARIEDELDRRDLECELTRSDFFLWYLLGSFFLVGPFIFHYKFIKAIDLLCRSYNEEMEAANKSAK